VTWIRTERQRLEKGYRSSNTGAVQPYEASNDTVLVRKAKADDAVRYSLCYMAFDEGRAISSFVTTRDCTEFGLNADLLYLQ
jgi:hypothetical protein